MGAGEIIAIVISALILCGAIFYIVKAKKSGKRCIGCPDASSCSGNCGSCCGCNKNTNNNE